jgi:hypothetical protein
MNRNPFKAPRAVVADTVIAPDPTPPPESITLACRLLWATVIVDLLSLIPGVRTGFWDDNGAAPAAVAVALVVVAVMTGIEIWLIRLVGRRHGWARWALLAYLIAGWVMTFSDFSASIAQGMAAVLVDLVTGLVEMFAIGVLFLSAGRRWFARNDNAG